MKGLMMFNKFRTLTMKQRKLLDSLVERYGYTLDKSDVAVLVRKRLVVKFQNSFMTNYHTLPGVDEAWREFRINGGCKLLGSRVPQK